MFLVNGLRSAMADAITGTVELCDDFPGAGVLDHNLSDTASLFVRFDGSFGKNSLTDLKGKGVWSLAIDVFAMHCSVFVN